MPDAIFLYVLSMLSYREIESIRTGLHAHFWGMIGFRSILYDVNL